MEIPKRKILIVDDSPEDRETWRRFLSSDPTCDYEFIESDSLEVGLETCLEQQPDCILLDYHLPDGNGVEFLDNLREIGGASEYAVVVLTATGTETVAVKVMKAGAQDYLIKHRLNAETLCRTLNGAVYKAYTDRLLAEQRLELEDAYRQAREANARKDQFLAVLSHELRTPLTPILALVSSPDLSRTGPAELEEIFAVIRRNVELEARLIDDLLDVTRIVHGKLDLNLQSVDIHQLIRHALDICRVTAADKNVELSAELSASVHEARADPARLQQVFWNLLNNAIKFVAPGGRVTIRTLNPVEGQIEIEVADNGIGITSERLQEIFDAFEQGGVQMSRKFGGLGLGLAICKALVEAHGGSIIAYSPGVDQGATFRVVLAAENRALPAGSENRAPAGVTPPPAASAASCCILLVEDHVDTARILSSLMRRRGYEVVHAKSVAEAITFFKTEPINVIVSDLGLPDGNGADLIRTLRAIRPAPSIVLSGYGEDDALSSSLAAGAQEHLTKPVMWSHFEETLNRVLKSSSLAEIDPPAGSGGGG